jgi:hypothetical protein
MEMKRKCKECSNWEKHFFWYHLDLTNVRLCKKMDATSFMKKMVSILKFLFFFVLVYLYSIL